MQQLNAVREAVSLQTWLLHQNPPQNLGMSAQSVLRRSFTGTAKIADKRCRSVAEADTCHRQMLPSLVMQSVVCMLF